MSATRVRRMGDAVRDPLTRCWTEIRTSGAQTPPVQARNFIIINSLGISFEPIAEEDWTLPDLCVLGVPARHLIKVYTPSSPKEARQYFVAGYFFYRMIDGE